MKNYKIAVAGTGYVGLSLSVLLAQHNQVMAVDIVQAKVDMINNHKSPIQDDYIEKYLAEKELNLTATLDAKAASTWTNPMREDLICGLMGYSATPQFGLFACLVILMNLYVIRRALEKYGA